MLSLEHNVESSICKILSSVNDVEFNTIHGVESETWCGVTCLVAGLCQTAHSERSLCSAHLQ